MGMMSEQMPNHTGQKDGISTHVVLPLLEDEAQELLHIVLPEGVHQVLGARQHALGLDCVVRWCGGGVDWCVD
jgi:hypothetical protein